MRIVLVPGTFANTDRHASQDEWWRPGSPFYREAKQRGIECLSFAWSTELDGIIGRNDDWEKGAAGLYRQTKDLSALRIVAHSHGGNVVAYAAAKHGLRILNLVTLATPVRKDIPYAEAKKNIRKWTHVYGGWRDYVQLAGSLFDGQVRFVRQMDDADQNIKVTGAGHSDLHEVRVWNESSLWSALED